MCKMYTDLFGLKTITFRYFNVYGERQPLKGQYAPVIGLFLKQHRRGKPMTVVGDGKQTRDYTYVGDVVEANLAACRCEKGFGEIFNIGTGNQTSINELVEIIGKRKKGNGRWSHVNIAARPGECRYTQADISKSNEILNWHPKIKLEDWIESQE